MMVLVIRYLRMNKVQMKLYVFEHKDMKEDLTDASGKVLKYHRVFVTAISDDSAAVKLKNPDEYNLVCTEVLQKDWYKWMQ